MYRKNQITLVGTVKENVSIDLQYGDNVLYKTFLEVKRSNGEKTDEIMLVATKEQFKKGNVEIGARVHVEGVLETRNVYAGKERIKEERKVVLYVRVKNIRRAFQETDKNEVIFAGTVSNRALFWTTASGRKRANLAVTVYNNDESTSSFIPCVAWGKASKKLKDLATGDLVVIQGDFHSRIYKNPKNPTSEDKKYCEIRIVKLI